MKLARLLNMIFLAALLAACVSTPGGNGTSAPNGGLPTPPAQITPAPSAQAAVLAFIDAWNNNDYQSMYAMLTKDSQSSIKVEDFETQYRDATNAMSLKTLEYSVRSTNTNPDDAEVNIHAIYHTVIIGDLERDTTFKLVREGAGWKVKWDSSLIFPDLAGGKKLLMNYQTPKRGDIYDRNGNPIATDDTVVALGLRPGSITADIEPTLLQVLSNLTGKPAPAIQGLYAFAQPDWYIPVGEISGDTYAKNQGVLDGLTNYGLLINTFEARYYYGDGVAPHAVGYVQALSKDDIDNGNYLRQGYSRAAMIGKSGIEASEESVLAGKTGGQLYVQDPDGTNNLIAQSDPQPGGSVYMTFDRDIQKQVQDALAGFKAAAVVIERDTGRVLALASAPAVDPNIFALGNPNVNVLNDANYMGDNPFFDRAAEGTYPLGSVFKIITISAAMQSGAFKPTDTLDCQYEWDGLSDHPRYDWTWDHYQQELAATGEGKTQPSGVLTLLQGLMRSCNPWFWQIGKTLYDLGKTTAISDMATGFGLGKPTGITGINESPGTISAPVDVYQAVNEAIGQDPVTVTPLQVARFVAAVGNGGTLYRPQLIEKIQPLIGDPTDIFQPDPQSKLPLSAENLKYLQEAMRSVITNSRGTGHRLNNLGLAIYGKTGTAQTGGDPHAWFAGYTDVRNPNKPDIAIAVFVENQGEGSQWALPIFQRIVEIYFYGAPQHFYPWESAFGVTREPTETPAPETPTEEATPEPSATP
jgi:cell division protein FtsI/penicillin-binding protein 2